MDERKIVAKKISGHTFPLSESSLEQLAGILIRREVPKGEFFLKEGEVSRSMGVIEKGMIRQFYNKKKHEVTEHITYEDHLFICLESFIRQVPARFYVEALEPCLIYEIPYTPFHELKKQNIEILHLYCKILESSLMISQNKADARCRQSVTERYFQLEREHPEIIKRAPQIYIASFLDMSPETLSRIRAARF